MVAKKVLNQKAITNADASEYLKEIENEFIKKAKELPFEIAQTKEYLIKVQKGRKLDKAIFEKLKELNLPEQVCIELANILPKNDEIIKTILYKKVDFTDDLVKKIKDILA